MVSEIDHERTVLGKTTIVIRRRPDVPLRASG
jgi:hypothetical protein